MDIIVFVAIAVRLPPLSLAIQRSVVLLKPCSPTSWASLCRRNAIIANPLAAASFPMRAHSFLSLKREIQAVRREEANTARRSGCAGPGFSRRSRRGRSGCSGGGTTHYEADDVHDKRHEGQNDEE